MHLFFNIIGILIFYPVPCMRWPIPLAQRLGDTTAEYRWFAAFYLVSAFFLLPVAVFLLSLAGPAALYSVLGALAAAFAVWGSVSLLQRCRPGWLPAPLRTWRFLPLWMRSLRPLDDLINSTRCAKALLPSVTVTDADAEETRNLTGGGGGAAGKNLAAGCCGGPTGAASTAGNSPDGITTKDLEIGAVCKLLGSHGGHGGHEEEEAALMQRLTCGDSPIVRSAATFPEKAFVLQVDGDDGGKV